MRHLRAGVRDNPRYPLAFAAACAALSAIVLYVWLQPEKPFRDVSEIWYFDLNTGKRYPVKWGEHREVPPQPAPSGKLEAAQGPLEKGDHAGARLHVFACGDCGQEQFEGYLELFDPKLRELQLKGEGLQMQTMLNFTFVRRVEGTAWHPLADPEAEAIIGAAALRCKGQRLSPCEVHH